MCGASDVDRMGSPRASAAEFHIAVDAPPPGGVPVTNRLRRAEGLHLVGVHAGGLGSDLHHRAPVGDEPGC